MNETDTKQWQRYLEAIEEVAVYPGSGGGGRAALAYCSLGLVGEAGEACEKIKKLIRDTCGDIGTAEAALGGGDFPGKEDFVSLLASELGDVCWYVGRLGVETGQTPVFPVSPTCDCHGRLEIHAVEMCRLASRASSAALGHGDGDVSTELSGVLSEVAACAVAFDLALADVMSENVRKLRDRKARGVLSGSGDRR